MQTLGMSEDYRDKNSAIYNWLVLFFGLSLLPSDEIMSTIPADDRCCISGDTSCGFIDFTFALLLKIYLHFRCSYLRFHNTAIGLTQ